MLRIGLVIGDGVVVRPTNLSKSPVSTRNWNDRWSVKLWRNIKRKSWVTHHTESMQIIWWANALSYVLHAKLINENRRTWLSSLAQTTKGTRPLGEKSGDGSRPWASTQVRSINKDRYRAFFMTAVSTVTSSCNRLELTHQHSDLLKPRVSITHNKAYEGTLRLSLRKPEECQWRAHPWNLRVIHETRRISPVEWGQPVHSSLGLGRSWQNIWSTISCLYQE